MKPGGAGNRLGIKTSAFRHSWKGNQLGTGAVSKTDGPFGVGFRVLTFPPHYENYEIIQNNIVFSRRWSWPFVYDQVE